MNKILVFLLRWLVGIGLVLIGVNTMEQLPVSATLALLFATIIIPQSAKVLFKRLKIANKPLAKLVVGALLFLLYGLSLPGLPHQGDPPTSSPISSPDLSGEVLPTPQNSVQPTASASASASASLYQVKSVVDGDTLKVEIDGVTQTVRIVGIDTPEVVDPRRPVECFGREASAKAKQLLTGQVVRLEIDETQQNRDRYGRLLRFVFLADGTDVGLQMISEGYAEESQYGSTPYRYRQSYLAAEAKAKVEKRGLWADNACLSSPTP